MDPGFYQDFTGRPNCLLIVLEDRLACDDASVIHWFTGARSDAVTLEEIAQTAAHRQIGNTVREYADDLALVGMLARANQAPPASELKREVAAHG